MVLLCVPTAHNVADLCSQGITLRKADPGCVYLKDPNFLQEPNLHVAFAEISVTDTTIHNA